MRARQIILGLVAYLGGAATLLVLTLAIGGTGLLDAIDAGDTVVLVVGAVLIALAALTLHSIEVTRPTPGGAEGGRPEAGKGKPIGDDFSWTSLAAIVGAGLAFAVAPRAEAEADLVEPARGTFEELVIDGDRDGTRVTFDHDHADERLSGPGETCARCHHLNLPGEAATPCSECHRSMDQITDIFDHALHAEALGGNEGCTTCHADPDEPRSREEMDRSCADCHTPEGDWAMAVMVPVGAPIEMGPGLAPSYVNAMHRLCLECHETIDEDQARCTVCHRSGAIRNDQPRPDSH